MPLLSRNFLLLTGILLPLSVFSQTNTWTGTEDTDWHKKCNWDLDEIPSCSHDVVIPNVTNDPVITGVAHCKTITIQTDLGAELTINSDGGGKLEVNTCPTTATDNGGCFVPCAASTTTIVDIISNTGRTWMDRNLGASRAALFSTDAMAYGSLYQWGRCSDGHQVRVGTTTTTTMSSTDQPGHSDFIIPSGGSPNDWRIGQNDGLWQPPSPGTNNPCPSGYRVPTVSETNQEVASWTSPDANGAFGSIKLTVSGLKFYWDGTAISGQNQSGYYWSSGLSLHLARYMSFTNTGSWLASGSNSGWRGNALTVRCIKD